MARRQVLILYRKSLLAQGIGSLLQKVRGLEVESLQLGHGEAPGGYSDGSNPDVIILDTCDLGSQARVSILRLLERHPRARIICLNPEDGRVEVFRKDQRVANRREELVQAIRSA